MKLPSVPLMLVAMALPFSVHAQLFSGCTDKVLADWSFDTKTLNPDYVDPSVSVTMNPIGVPNNGVGYGQGSGGLVTLWLASRTLLSMVTLILGLNQTIASILEV